MKVLILAAGYATRLYPLTIDTPKCLLPVAGKTILDWLCEKLDDLKEFEEIVVVTNAKFFEKLNAWKKNIQTRIPIRLVNDGTISNETRLGAVRDMRLAMGRQKNARQIAAESSTGSSADWLVLASDNLFDSNFNEFLSFAKAKKDAVSIALYDIQDRKLAAGRFGVIEINSSSEVVNMEEKPKNPKSSFVGMGVYYFPRATLGWMDEYLRRPDAKDAPGYYLQWLARQKDDGRARIFGFAFSGMWYDIGDLGALEQARLTLKREKIE